MDHFEIPAASRMILAPTLLDTTQRSESPRSAEEA